MEITAGTAAERKIAWLVHRELSANPTSTGPTMAPTRPTPKLAPIPVERKPVG